LESPPFSEAEGGVDVNYSKKENATGGNLHVPDYDLIFDNVDSSMIAFCVGVCIAFRR
jgi:hypothetical protein